VEHVRFECKGGLYDTKTLKSKIELAKDISALANSSGGYLLIGPATKKNPFHEGDEPDHLSTRPLLCSIRWLRP
jgi:predicted HTH transcriptional regulator